MRHLLTVGFVLIVAACSPAIASPSPVTPATSAPATPSPVADLPSALREILRAPGPHQKLVADVQVDYARKGGPATGDVVPTYLGSETAMAVTYAEIDLGDGPQTIVHLVSSHRGVAYDVVWTLGAGTVQERFDTVGDVATSWAWTDEATP